MNDLTGKNEPKIFVTITPIPRPVRDWGESERAARQAAAEQRRIRPDFPTQEELDRERRERYAAEREKPTGFLAMRIAAMRMAADPEGQRAHEQSRAAAFRGSQPKVPTTKSSPSFALETVTDFDHHSLALNGLDPDANDIDFVSRPLNELTASTDSGLMIYSGVAYGPVRLHLYAATEEPDIDASEWDRIVEVPIETPEGRVEFSSLLGDDVPAVNMATAGPGTYQVRVGDRGFDLAYDETVDEPVEDILIQVWPSKTPRTQVIK